MKKVCLCKRLNLKNLRINETGIAVYKPVYNKKTKEMDFKIVSFEGNNDFEVFCKVCGKYIDMSPDELKIKLRKREGYEK